MTNQELSVELEKENKGEGVAFLECIESLETCLGNLSSESRLTACSRIISEALYTYDVTLETKILNDSDTAVQLETRKYPELSYDTLVITKGNTGEISLTHFDFEQESK